MRRFALVLLAAALVARAEEVPLRVLTSTTDLADIVRVVGGDRVTVSSLCKGPEDPHFLDAPDTRARAAGVKALYERRILEIEGRRPDDRETSP